MVKILIVDDSAFERDVIRKYLAIGGFTDVIEAENGEGALRKYNKENPDLILLDMILPDGHGSDLVKKFSDVKVIIISIVNDKRVIEKCLNNGAVGYLLKPIKESSFLNEIRKVLGK